MRPRKIPAPQPPRFLLYYVHPAARFSQSGTGPPLERAGAFFITMKANIYLQDVAAKGGIETIFGYYNKNKTWLPAIDQRCVNCEVTGEGSRVHVMKFEEKRTDANIITEMLRDAFTSDIQSFVLISGDSDFAAPLDLIRQELRRRVVVLNPKDRRSDLIHHATIYKDIPRDLPAKCQLPDAIPVGTHGNFIRRPAAWK